jgi:molybdenum cofactor biosynthesis enzyme MoaA
MAFAGLNINLDSLDHERFRAITRRGDLDQGWPGSPPRKTRASP